MDQWFNEKLKCALLAHFSRNMLAGKTLHERRNYPGIYQGN
jgi:hypothetical protein